MKKIINFLTILIAIILTTSLVSATKNFTASPDTIIQNTIVGESNRIAILLNNTGDEQITLNLTYTNPIKNSDTITLQQDPDASSITLEPQQTYTRELRYNTENKPLGTYTGSILVMDAKNSSLSKTIPVTLNIERDLTQANLEIIGNTFVRIEGDLGDTEKIRITLKNNGSIALTNIRLDTTDLEGESTIDEIDESDIEIEPESNIDLDPQETKTIEIQVDIPKSIDPGTYVGKLKASTSQDYEKFWDLKVIAIGDDIDVIIEQNKEDVINGILELKGEEGETIRDYKILISNDGDMDITNLSFQIDSDLEEQFSAKTIPVENIEFRPSNFDVYKDDDRKVEVRVTIPKDQPNGNYFGKIRLVSSKGFEYDSIRIKIRVVGEVYTEKINMPKTIMPGENLKLNITLRNIGSKLYTDIKVTATITNIDSLNSDLTESTNNIILDVNDRKTQTLIFKIPENARDGSHAIEIQTEYDDQTITEVEEFEVQRETHNIEIESYSINPSILKCENTLYSYIKAKNNGKVDEDIKIITEIQGTNIKETSETIELKVDQTTQKNFYIDISSLKEGKYVVTQKITYSGGLFEKEESTLKILNCGEANIEINLTNNENKQTETETNTTITLLGKEVEKSTAYLGGGLGGVLVLIIVALFFL